MHILAQTHLWPSSGTHWVCWDRHRDVVTPEEILQKRGPALGTGGHLIPPVPNSRHDAREVEELSREIGHVAVEEDEEGLDDSDVGGEAGGEGSNQPVNDAHKDAAQRHHEEAEEAEDDVDNGHLLKVGKLLEKVVEDLGMRRERGFQAALLPTDTLSSEESCSGTASTRTQPHGGQLPILHGLQGHGAAGHVSRTALLPSTHSGGASVKDEPAGDRSCFPTGWIQAGGPPTATWGEKPAPTLLSTDNSPNILMVCC